jgi:hypothetical protein
MAVDTVKNIVYTREVIWGKIAADILKVIEAQQKEIEALKRLVKELSEKIARLEKNSTNSSRPPSSDITKPPKKEGGKGQKCTPGAQKGHKSTKGLRSPRTKLTEPSSMNYRIVRVAAAI